MKDKDKIQEFLDELCGEPVEILEKESSIEEAFDKGISLSTGKEIQFKAHGHTYRVSSSEWGELAIVE